MCKNDVAFQIFEDDVLFLDDYHTLVEKALMELPPDWDALFLGASPQENQERYSPHLFRLKNAKCTQAIIWHNRENGAVDWILSHRSDIGKIDRYYYETIFPKFNCFLIYPLLCTQTQFDSDTCGRSDVSTIQKNYNLYCP
jgi:GR25 family glycosyltransferase involved in LPS biosynthesis